MADEGESDFVPLTAELLSAGLSEILPIVGGGGFAFTKLDCSERDPKINHLGNKLEDCEHLRHVKLSGNQIRDITAVSRLPHLLSLQADNNEINSIQCFCAQAGEEDLGTNLPWCQRVDLSTNKLQALPSLALLGRLRFLRLEGNEITSLEAFGAHPSLEELELQGNKLTNLRGLGPCEQLRRLDVSENELTTLEGLDAPALVQLVVQKNQLTSLDHIGGAASCSELNVADNQLAAPEEPDSMPQEFIKLGQTLPGLRKIMMSGNPVGDLKLELLCCIPELIQVDDDPVTAEEREGAVERGQQIKEAEEARRIAAEEAAREAAAAEAEGGGQEEE